MVVRITVESPATISDYGKAIKACIGEYGHEYARYVAARLKTFQQNTSKGGI